MNCPTETALVAYIPSPHRGYLDFLRAHPGSVLYLFGRDIIDEFPSLVRNLPAAEPQEVRSMIQALGLLADVRILSKDNAGELSSFERVVMPDEDVSRAVATRYIAHSNIAYDASWKLRWHWDATVKKERPVDTATVTTGEFDRDIMSKAVAVAEKSSDWWRQVGAVLVKDGAPVLAAYNAHQPTEQNPYLYGDPRSNFDSGQHIEAASALHAEVGVLTEAARRGIMTEGADLYVTTFPCPPCAYACANAGIRRLYYSEGYSLVEGADALRAKGVEIIRVVDKPTAS